MHFTYYKSIAVAGGKGDSSIPAGFHDIDTQLTGFAKKLLFSWYIYFFMLIAAYMNGL